MNYNSESEMNFLIEMTERQVSAREFFSTVLIDSLNRNFGLKSVVIFCFDPDGNFLSWIDKNGINVNGPRHPYHTFGSADEIRSQVYRDAVRDHLTYFDTKPRIYRATDVIREDYDNSSYAAFLEENFQSHYAVIMAMGINAYIQLMFLKTREEGDFTGEELEELERIYIHVANSYKTFKKHEQSKIVSNIQDEIIQSGDKAYLVTDDFMHVLSYNQVAQNYISDLLGSQIVEELNNGQPCSWLPFLLKSGMDDTLSGRVQTSVIKDYIFKVYTYERDYTHGIIDRYHWITIAKEETTENKVDRNEAYDSLTKTEKKVADYLCAGLTYQAIADEMVISYHTVKNHVQNIFYKCGVKSRYELFRILKKN